MAALCNNKLQVRILFNALKVIVLRSRYLETFCFLDTAHQYAAAFFYFYWFVFRKMLALAYFS